MKKYNILLVWLALGGLVIHTVTTLISGTFMATLSTFVWILAAFALSLRIAELLHINDRLFKLVDDYKDLLEEEFEFPILEFPEPIERKISSN